MFLSFGRKLLNFGKQIVPVRLFHNLNNTEDQILIIIKSYIKFITLLLSSAYVIFTRVGILNVIILITWL